jgi:hypothetical protein
MFGESASGAASDRSGADFRVRRTGSERRVGLIDDVIA